MRLVSISHLLIFGGALLLTTACPFMKEEGGSESAPPGSSSVVPNGDKTFVSSQLKQDVYFEYVLSGATSSSFSIVGKPDWATFNASTGKVSGYPSVAGVVPDIIIKDASGTTVATLKLTVQGDPFTRDAWHLGNTGQKSFSSGSGVAGQDLKVLEVLRAGGTGEGIRVAVSDSGAQIGHEDLTNNVISQASRNYALSAPYTGDPSPSAASGATGDHGTSVSGIIAAEGWNGKGLRGIAPKAGLAAFNYIPYQTKAGVLLNQVTGNFDVFNQSWGSGFEPGRPVFYTTLPTDYRALLKSNTTTQRAGKGATLVRAAGNEYYREVYQVNAQGVPTVWLSRSANSEEDNAVPWVVVVGALNATGKKSSYSSTGSNLWISGTGGEYGSTSPAMITTDVSGCTGGYSRTPIASPRNTFEVGQQGNAGCNYTSIFNGTSSAAPSISAVVALILEANPNLGWRDVKHILAATATQTDPNYVATRRIFDPTGYISEPGWFTNGAGYKFHNWYGFGRANAKAAVDLAKTYTSNWGPLLDLTDAGGNLKYSNNVNITIPDNTAIDPANDTITVTENYKIESVYIELTAIHPYGGDLGVELISPAGTRSVLMEPNNALNVANLSNVKLLSNAFYGEQSAGAWKVVIIDGLAGPGTTLGRLTNWKINILGH